MGFLRVPKRSADLSCLGSSPRAWETAASDTRSPEALQFIPTCVGNRRASRPCGSHTAVHPHVRGEQKDGRDHTYRPCGSSPRAWGTGGQLRWPGLRRRFIPTCVGNRVLAEAAHRALQVHPHVRGEQAVLPRPALRPVGSSPRAWGTAGVLALVFGARRFIPTCVGNRFSLASG